MKTAQPGLLSPPASQLVNAPPRYAVLLPCLQITALVRIAQGSLANDTTIQNPMEEQVLRFEVRARDCWR